MPDQRPAIDRLLDVMVRLRDPQRGCPWDREQNFATIAPYTIEEAYEVADAIERHDWEALRDELGDLLFQVVFHARMAEEAEMFDFAAVAHGLIDKMVRRHPHVFDSAKIESAAAQTVAWEAHKAAERNAKSGQGDGEAERVLAGIPPALPALLRAQKLQKRAARVGFDWPAIGEVRAKLDEELRELDAELTQGAAPDRIEAEIGDLLFAAVNLARFAGVDAETALRRGNAKFERRFARVEDLLRARGKRPDQATLAEMDALWDQAKAEETAKAPPPEQESASGASG